MASIVQVAVVSLNGDPIPSAFSVVASSVVAAALLLAYYVRRFYFEVSLKHILKITVAYSALSAVFLLIHLNVRLLSFVEIALSFLIYFLLLSILGLFDERDVDIIFSPLPRQSAEIVKKAVIKLNSTGHL